MTIGSYLVMSIKAPILMIVRLKGNNQQYGFCDCEINRILFLLVLSRKLFCTTNTAF